MIILNNLIPGLISLSTSDITLSPFFSVNLLIFSPSSGTNENEVNGSLFERKFVGWSFIIAKFLNIFLAFNSKFNFMFLLFFFVINALTLVIWGFSTMWFFVDTSNSLVTNKLAVTKGNSLFKTVILPSPSAASIGTTTVVTKLRGVPFLSINDGSLSSSNEALSVEKNANPAKNALPVESENIVANFLLTSLSSTSMVSSVVTMVANEQPCGIGIKLLARRSNANPSISGISAISALAPSLINGGFATSIVSGNSSSSEIASPKPSIIASFGLVIIGGRVITLPPPAAPPRSMHRHGQSPDAPRPVARAHH